MCGDKANSTFYRFINKQISVLTVFDTRQHPQKLNKDFKNER